MTLLQLYQRAEDENVEIDGFKMREVTSVCFPEGWIAIDYAKVKSSIQEKELLAHELGHYETGAFYRAETPLLTRAKCESKAQRKAIALLVPEKEFRDALNQGYKEYWELAEFFNVSYEFMIKVMEYYYGRRTLLKI